MESNCSYAKRQLEKSISLYYNTLLYCTIRCCLTVVYIVVLIIQKQYQLPAAAEVVSVSTPATLTSPAQLCRNPDTNTISQNCATIVSFTIRILHFAVCVTMHSSFLGEGVIGMQCRRSLGIINLDFPILPFLQNPEKK